MAEPITAKSSGAVPLMEETIQILRESPFSVLLYHWIGSVPFALALTVFWNSLTSQRLSDRDCALQALLVAILLLWMNVWRAVYAGHLYRQLTGAPAARRSWTQTLNLIGSQSLLGAIKLVAIPLAGLVMFPMANAVAFFRTAAAFGDREDLEPSQLIAHSRELSRLHQRQNWGLLPVLLLLYLVMAANMALLYVLLPYLVRMLTGYEPELTRAAGFVAQTPLFVVFVFISAWTIFDPFVQAVYCVRAFHAESVRTGGDLRVGLRRHRAVRTAALLALLAFVPAVRAQGVTSDQLEKASRQAMQAPEYGWRIPPPPSSGISGRPLVLRAADKVLGVLNAAWRAVGKGIRMLLDWIFGKLIGSNPGEGGAAPGAGLHWSIYVGIAFLAIAILIVARRLQPPNRKAKALAGSSTAPVRIDEEGVTADQLPEERWMEIALQCLGEEKFRLALRAYYLFSLAWLGRRGFIAIDAGKTNREYEQELRRKAREFGEARGLFGANLSAFEAAWYGLHEVSADSVHDFQIRLEGMKKALAPAEPR